MMGQGLALSSIPPVHAFQSQFSTSGATYTSMARCQRGVTVSPDCTLPWKARACCLARSRKLRGTSRPPCGFLQSTPGLALIFQDSKSTTLRTSAAGAHSAAGPKHMTPSPHLSSPRSCSSLLLAFLLPTTSLLSPSPNPHPLFPSPSRPLLPSWRLVNHHLVGPRRARRAAPRLLEHSEPWWKFPETY